MNPEMLSGMLSAARQLRRQRSLRAAIPRGEGRAFCAGMESKWGLLPDMGGAVLRRGSDALPNIETAERPKPLRAWASFRKPISNRINGSTDSSLHLGVAAVTQRRSGGAALHDAKAQQAA
ncbi:hypothetical protein RM530_04790 [Algiphilus sp. W345]|uniref:Uncharacterized protein n=1 Tax=Banduia mediterranea TaxID=3075609 RepID=A0ABU2WGN5_9GAMM|nr:hypothetical protein [Algiphilus sp. W345]MDT0496678.1 hypothetical protein [Algiphilus sp. W345]